MRNLHHLFAIRILCHPWLVEIVFFLYIVYLASYLALHDLQNKALITPHRRGSFHCHVCYFLWLIHATSFFSSCLLFQSLTAALMASSASMEQCNFTGGNFKCAAMSEFFRLRASSTDLPLTHSVATDEAAIADPHPKVLKTDSVMFPSSSTLI
mmetsp:Transcript_19860/g.49408  ORF Transcript_19860/g.49408 Transcript_19860/m.49408 type:complete len:154 (+) Transcript_19860:152-613(+)